MLWFWWQTRTRSTFKIVMKAIVFSVLETSCKLVSLSISFRRHCFLLVSGWKLSLGPIRQGGADPFDGEFGYPLVQENTRNAFIERSFPSWSPLLPDQSLHLRHRRQPPNDIMLPGWYNWSVLSLSKADGTNDMMTKSVGTKGIDSRLNKQPSLILISCVAKSLRLVLV